MLRFNNYGYHWVPTCPSVIWRTLSLRNLSRQSWSRALSLSTLLAGVQGMWRGDWAGGQQMKVQTVRARAHWPLCLATCGRVFVADPSTLGRHVCYVCKRSVCGGDEPQPVAHLSHKLQCARKKLENNGFLRE